MKTSKNETNQVEPMVTGISSNGIRAERLVRTTNPGRRTENRNENSDPRKGS